MVLFAPVCVWTLLAEPVPLADFETLDGWQVIRKPAAVEPTSGAAVGKGALRVTLPGMVQKTLARRFVPGSAAWDGYEGVSFWVKGDGSDQFGSLALRGSYAFVTFFPLKDTSWHKLVLPWSAFVPESQVGHIGETGGMPPSGINAIRLGCRWTIWHNNARIPAHGFGIDQIQLEERVPGPGPVPRPRPFGEVLARLKARQPVRIQCMGDSITAGTGLADRDRERYAVLVREGLRRWLGYDGISCYSRAVGGAKLLDARAWVPRDFYDEPPDLVTVWYGYNDKSAAHTKAYFKRSLNDYLDRIRRQTKGRSALLLFATGPGAGPRFVMLDDYAEAVRETARERGLPCFDVNLLMKALGREGIMDYMADMAHPNKKGHQYIADGFCRFLIEQAGIDTPKPAPPPKPEAPPGEAHAWNFDDGTAGWRFDTQDVTLAPERTRSGEGAVAFRMKGPANDHLRAWSPPVRVVPWQRYRIEAWIYTADMQAGLAGLYMATHGDAEGMNKARIHRIAAPQTKGRWERLKGEFEIPEGVASMRVLVWAERKGRGTFFCDDVTITPLP